MITRVYIIYGKSRPLDRAEAGRRANAAGRRANAPPPHSKVNIRRRNLLIHIEELPPKPLHILIREFLLLIQEIVGRSFCQVAYE